ncbi:hypothetical protein [Tanticharoenia sakaeratensis]|uniref:Uncharacterized protein n=1 Tax=Tanticharoenia sakaeratensis NBRC 103193 TaxID=1231623 RepID=A0A0D6MNL4_9PROT|nr:hypothetical protein [Tanticharoenia sakaeratensis]GAN55254.1 hypothetical protein Tasa_041_049 [Tanticharoenia sakaeratensis NBRC 103193]GBQ23366.1 hypothetical protein AA103193_2391 [Tanticharoenia sakaeratensis NBRC 103193]
MSGTSATSAGSSASEPVSGGGTISSGGTAASGTVVSSGGAATSGTGAAPSFEYVVRSPFASYKPGDVIKDAATIEALSKTGQLGHNCVRVLSAAARKDAP